MGWPELATLLKVLPTRGVSVSVEEAGLTRQPSTQHIHSRGRRWLPVTPGPSLGGSDNLSFVVSSRTFSEAQGSSNWPESSYLHRLQHRCLDESHIHCRKMQHLPLELVGMNQPHHHGQLLKRLEASAAEPPLSPHEHWPSLWLQPGMVGLDDPQGDCPILKYYDLHSVTQSSKNLSHQNCLKRTFTWISWPLRDAGMNLSQRNKQAQVASLPFLTGLRTFRFVPWKSRKREVLLGERHFLPWESILFAYFALFLFWGKRT